MARVTFIRDVTLPGENGPGPHFRRGYSPDVSEAEARRLIASGDAVEGVVSLPDDAAEKPVAFKTKQRFRAF